MSEQNKPVQFSAQIDGVRTLKDGGLKITIDTQELPPEEKALLFGFSNAQIWAVFKATEIKPEEIDIAEPNKEFKSDKTPSQRLRARLFVYYKNTHKDESDFYNWYAKTLEDFGNKYLEKMN